MRISEMRKKYVYMDHNATTPLHPEVKKAMKKVMNVFGNPSSPHEIGRRASGLIEEVRAKAAAFIGAQPDEIVFTGSGTEANNAVLNTLTYILRRQGLVTTSIEHVSILEPAKHLEDKGIKVFYLAVDCLGKINMEELKGVLTEKTGLVSVMMANNEIGTIQDVKEIAAVARKNGALFHTDAVQAVGKIPVDVKELDVDFLTFSGHKIYGPKGVGVLYIKRETFFSPLIRGGHQEKERRAGTENTLGIIGLGKAVEMRIVEMKDEEKRLLKLKELLKNGIRNNIPNARFNGHPHECLANTLNVSFDGVEGGDILMKLDREGIAVSTGAACVSGSFAPSHVLLATGMQAERVHNSIRISMGRENTIEDVEYLLEKLSKTVK